jgi:hypothetical protein
MIADHQDSHRRASGRGNNDFADFPEGAGYCLRGLDSSHDEP